MNFALLIIGFILFVVGTAMYCVEPEKEFCTRPVGSLFRTSDGGYYQVMESGPTCTGCDLKDCLGENQGYCTAGSRSDGTEVIFKRIK